MKVEYWSQRFVEGRERRLRVLFFLVLLSVRIRIHALGHADGKDAEQAGKQQPREVGRLFLFWLGHGSQPAGAVARRRRTDAHRLPARRVHAWPADESGV